MNFEGKCPIPIKECTESGRSDKSYVIFKKLKKVGEPYTTFVDKTIQNYILETEVSVPPKNAFVLINNEQRLIAIEIKQNKEDMEEKKLNLKPFDIQKAREGKPVCTRDGRKTRIICFDKVDKRPIVGLISDDEGEFIYEYLADGKCYNGKDDSYDLMMLPEKKEGWVNIYHDKEGNIYTDENVYNTEKDAINFCPHDKCRVATVKIEWEE